MALQETTISRTTAHGHSSTKTMSPKSIQLISGHCRTLISQGRNVTSPSKVRTYYNSSTFNGNREVLIRFVSFHPRDANHGVRSLLSSW